MKIQKIKLTEADELINPQEDSVAEITDAVQDAADDELSSKAATEVAAEIKDAGNTLGADTAVIANEEDPLEMQNRLTEALERAFKANKRFNRQHIKEVANVLVSGLPGSSKTASVYNWAAFKSLQLKNLGGEPINITYINAKNNDLEAFINGYTVQDPEDKLIVTQAVSRNLDGLDRPNSILFLDEYNRQTKQQIRASLLTLINEHYVVGKDKDGKHYFPNFLFTVAAINPPVPEDEGAAALNDAEKSRFLYKVKDFDSDPAVTASYLKQAYEQKINKLLQQADLSDPEVQEDLETYLRILDLGTFIVGHEDFKYDTTKELRDLYNKDRTMLNQRTLTAALAATGGFIDELRSYIKNDSDYLDKNIENLENILDDYSDPTFDQLLAKYNIKDAKLGNNTELNTSTTTEAEPGEEDEKEDDEEFFSNASSNATNAGKTLTAQQVDTIVRNVISNW